MRAGRFEVAPARENSWMEGCVRVSKSYRNSVRKIGGFYWYYQVPLMSPGVAGDPATHQEADRKQIGSDTEAGKKRGGSSRRMSGNRGHGIGHYTPV